MKDRRKNRKKRRLLLALYLALCLCIILFAYLHLRRIAENYNTDHLELITGLYAEKMNESMEYLQNYAQEDVTMVEAMKDAAPSRILQSLTEDLDQTVFCNVGFLLNDGELLGTDCAVADIKKKELDAQALLSGGSFTSDPYQSSETGTMIMTVFVPVKKSPQIRTLYLSIAIEDLRKLGIYELLRGKINVHLLKADSENFITCISSGEDTAGNWNNLLLQQKYFTYNAGYSYHDWVKDMRAGKKDGQFSAQIRGEDCTIAYRSISGMPNWYVIVELANKNISNVTQNFSIWGGIYGGILVGFTILYMLFILLLEKKDKKLYMGLSTIDSLTEILNRRAFQNAVEAELSKKTPGVFLFIDVDNFKRYNDQYGHSNGDLCLKHIAKAMHQCFPAETLLGRYGGDEFVVYLKAASSSQVSVYMQAFRKAISPLILPTGEEVPVSVSAGGASFPEQGKDYVSLCRSADAALYEVKQTGKDAFKMKTRSGDKAK
ncbi:MAG: GGDEF domain-containing protein [Lachnospiraceae bacterium]|nr:GGDEF domain-containing protein [Lachnospiraceae bacterium]